MLSFQCFTKLPSALRRNSSTWLSLVPAPFAQTSSAGVCWDDPTPRARSPARGKVPLRWDRPAWQRLHFRAQLPASPVGTCSTHRPGCCRARQYWCTGGSKPWGTPQCLCTCIPASSWGGSHETHDPKEPCHRKSSSGGGRFGAGLIRLQWGCGGSWGSARLGAVGPWDSLLEQGCDGCSNMLRPVLYQRNEGCHVYPLERDRGLIS